MLFCVVCLLTGISRSLELPLQSVYTQQSIGGVQRVQDSVPSGATNVQLKVAGTVDTNLIGAKLSDDKNYGYSDTDTPVDSYGNPVTPYSLLPNDHSSKQQQAVKYVTSASSQGEQLNKGTLSFVLPSYANGVTKVQSQFGQSIPTNSFGVQKLIQDLQPPVNTGKVNINVNVAQPNDSIYPKPLDPAQYSDYEATVPSFPLVVPDKYASNDGGNKQNSFGVVVQKPTQDLLPPSDGGDVGSSGPITLDPAQYSNYEATVPSFPLVVPTKPTVFHQPENNNNNHFGNNFGASSGVLNFQSQVPQPQLQPQQQFHQQPQPGFAFAPIQSGSNYQASATTTKPIIQTLDGKYTGGFNGPPGILRPYDNLDTRFGRVAF